MAHDLHPHQETFRDKSARHRSGEEAGHRNVVSGLHPVEVHLHLYAVELGYIALLYVEGRHTCATDNIRNSYLCTKVRMRW